MTQAFELIEQGNGYAFISPTGKDFRVTKEVAIAKVMNQEGVVKVEGLEQYYGEPGTVHAFISPKGAASFPYHTDLEDLVIRCIEGQKIMDVAAARHTLNVDDEVVIPEGVLHRALNRAASITLSIEQCKSL